jgi:AraC-like DNA-binding protein
VPVVAVFQGEASLRAALRRGLPAGTSVRDCASATALDRLLGRELVDAVVLRARGARWTTPVPELHTRFPRIPVFGYGRFRPDDGASLLEALGLGVEMLLVEGVDEPVAGELVAALAVSRVRGRELADAPRLLRLSEDVQRQAWTEVLRLVGRRTTTADIARALGRSREHLSREFAAGGAPNLKRVIDLARVACAADLFRNPGYQVAGVAAILRFASPGHLAGTARRIAGVPPLELGRLGPRGVLQRFLRGRTRSRI